MKKLYRAQEENKIAGICVGLGEYFSVDPVIFRIIFILFFFISGLGLLAYIIMWIMVPLRDQDKLEPGSARKVYLSTESKKIAGVCGGLGEFFNLDPVFFRIGFIVLAFIAGIGIVFYVFLWLIIPKHKS